MAENSGFTTRLGQTTDSTISSGLAVLPMVDRSGPTVPPAPPTLWHDRQASVADRNTTAPRIALPFASASASTSLARFAS